MFVVCRYGLYTNQSTHHSPTTPDKNKKPGEGEGLSPDKVGGTYCMYLFHSHNIVGCLASIGGFWENDTYTQGGTFVLLIVNRPNDLYGRFLFSSFIFSFSTLRVRKSLQ